MSLEHWGRETKANKTLGIDLRRSWGGGRGGLRSWQQFKREMMKRFAVDHGCDKGNDDTDNYDDDNIGGGDDDDDGNDKDDNEVKRAANPTQPASGQTCFCGQMTQYSQQVVAQSKI